MKAWSTVGILAVVVALLCSTTASAWYVSREYTDTDKYETNSEDTGYAKADYGGHSTAYSYADVYAEIEGEQQDAYGGAYAYVYWTDTIMGYDPEWDPPLLAVTVHSF